MASNTQIYRFKKVLLLFFILILVNDCIEAFPKVRLGIFNQNNIIIIKAKPNENIQTGFLSASIVNIKYLTSYNLNIANVNSQYSLALTNSFSNGQYSYKVFATASGATNFNWLANVEYEIVRFNVTGNQPFGNFEISNDQFIINSNGACYIEHSIYGDITDTLNPIYQSNISGIPLPITISTSSIEDYNLFQNYPNPFNTVTIIAFYIPIRSNIKLSIFDVNGKIVSVILNKELPIGMHKYMFNFENIASGVYYYQMETENYFKTKKFIIIK